MNFHQTTTPMEMMATLLVTHSIGATCCLVFTSSVSMATKQIQNVYIEIDVTAYNVNKSF